MANIVAIRGLDSPVTCYKCIFRDGCFCKLNYAISGDEIIQAAEKGTKHKNCPCIEIILTAKWEYAKSTDEKDEYFICSNCGQELSTDTAHKCKYVLG